MNQETLFREMETLRQRVARLDARLNGRPVPSDLVLAETLEELRTSMEELRVAEEELRQQNEELLTSHLALEVERQRYQDLFDFAPDGYLVTDLHGKIEEANHAAVALLNTPHHFLVGKLLVLFIPEAERGTFRQDLFQLVQGKTIQERELRLQPGHEARAMHVALRVSVVRNAQGQAIALRWLFRDVTARKQAEEQLHLLNQELERRVQERTAALEEANRHKNEFLAVLAHELRNPLAAIFNALHLHRHRSKGLDNDVFGPILERQSRHMARLIDDLLDVSRITRGKIRLRKEAMELATAVSSALETTRPLIDDRGHQLTVSLPPEPIWLEADPTRLEQVLANLLHNAAKYTEPGGMITLAAQRNGSEVEVRICDTGIGIAADFLPRIFDLFSQGERAMDRSQGGLGLGLTLVKNLVEMHGGSITAHSAGVGQGSEFCLRLPVLERSTGQRAEAPAGAEPAKPQDLHILVVEDNADSAETLAMFLRLAGHEVQVALDGAAALGEVQTRVPDVVLLDIGLPRMDGYEVARRMRALRGLEKVHLVALTGYGQEEDRRRSLEAGFDHHLVKPVDPQRLNEFLTGVAAVQV